MGFQQQISIRRKQTFSQRINEDMFESVNAIPFECKELGIFLGNKFNNGKLFSFKEADETPIYISDTLFAEFKKEMGVKRPYTFNEMKYFHQIAFTVSGNIGNAGQYLTEISLPEMREFGFITFAYFEDLKEVHLPEGIKSLYGGAFCYSGLEKINLPDSLLYLGDNVFTGTKLKEIVVPKGITRIGFRCFAETYLKKIILPNSLKEIGESAFDDSAFGITDIAIPNSVTEIGESCFRKCKKLKHVKLSNKIEQIPCKCFEECTSLEKIDLPTSVKMVEFDSFNNCTSLKEITLHSPVYFCNDPDGYFPKGVTFRIPKKYEGIYLYSKFSSNTSNTVKDISEKIVFY